MFRIDIPNVLPLATVRWTPVTVTIFPCQTLRAPTRVIDKGIKKDLYMSILRRMTTTPINEGFLPCLNEY
jgi:hypothetical protein